ncbi:MAG TPA: hypothetical protein VMH41_12705 [Mycobacteriales bacterium]|nr:hypothetical protein [Mycobacteriales bacterium]
MSGFSGEARRRIAGRVLLGALGVAAMSTVAMGSAAATGSPEGWSLSPAPVHGADNRAAISYKVADKQTIHDAVTLANPTSSPISFKLYPANAFNQPIGGAFALGLKTAPKVGATRWITLATSHLTVPAANEATIPVKIHVPAHTTPGDYTAGVVALDTQVVRNTGGQVSLGVQHAVGVRVYLTVAGPRKPGLAVHNVAVHRSGVQSILLGGGKSTVTYDVSNTGNTRLDANANVKVVNRSGHVVHRFPTTHLLALLPGSRVHVSEKWNAPRSGRFRIKVVVTSGKVVATGQTSILIIPWVIVVGVFGAAGAAAIAGLHHLRHLRHVRHLRRAALTAATAAKAAVTR